MTKLFPFQEKGVRMIQRFGGRCLLADEMGMGKSLQSITWAIEYLREGPFVVVCPLPPKMNWEREWRIHVGVRAQILESTKPVIPRITSKVYVINYDILFAWAHVLRSLRPKLVILDECHALSGKRTRRTKAAKYLCRYVPHVIGLSGTPLTNRPADLFPILNIVRPDLYPNYDAYAWEFCGRKRTIWGWDDRGARNLGKLHADLKEHLLIRRTKEDVLSELPPKSRHIIPISLNDPSEYIKAEKEFLSWLGEEGRKTKTHFKRDLRTKLIHLRKLVGELKLDSVYEWTDEFLDSGEKLILFAHHVNVVKGLYKRYANKAVLVNGSVKGTKRQEAFDAFNSNPRIKLFVGNIKAAGLGWSAKNTSTVAFAELPWTPGEVGQAEDRLHGISRGVEGKPLSVFFLIANGTVEEDLTKMLQRKSHVVSATIDGKDKRQDLDVYNLLVKEMKKRRK